MASLIISSSVSLTRSQPSIPTRAFFKPPHVSKPPAIRFLGDPSRRRTRGLTAVTRAGPSTSYYIFAFALPFSLLAITIFASIRVADKLDRDYFQELEINQAIREANEDEDDEEEGEEDKEDINISFKKEPALQRTRNRPKRAA
ncbi:uncharacterized protein LOC132167115 [Corylus avellana]|uniref:uncharacterized protein LOC132167115 n=1 Tax=Corylus avellana TaxID=13451 RepID=UPI001E2329F2|nr:uncharacterized protein LOC132167115 [Corylus avellana]